VAPSRDSSSTSYGEAMNAASTVFVLNSSWEFRTELSRVLTAAGYQARLFESAEGFLAAPDAGTPGCVLLDIALPGISGLELQRSLLGSPYARPMVFLTGEGDIQISVNAMKAGAIDFLTKPIDHTRLFCALEAGIRLDVAQRGERAIRNVIRERLKQLTKRERQVMEQVTGGRLNKQIASDLGIGEKTVKVHRGRVMSKMMVRSVPELVQLAAKAGIAKATPRLEAMNLTWQQA
jgi:FixJ family two-component response regulator